MSMRRIVITAAAILSIVVPVIGAPADLTGIWMPTAIGPDGAKRSVWPEQLPFLPEVQAMVDAYRANYDPIEDDAGRNCLPYGMPQQMLGVAQYPMEIIETPDRLTMLYELHNDVREIRLDERGHPEGWLPTFMGHSIGWYEGETLIIETTGIRAGGLPRPHSPALKVTERINRVDGGERGEMLAIDLILDDPLVYREPVTVRNYFWRATDIEMGEYFCSEDLWLQNLRGDENRIPWR